ncbi:hypothetical protein [Neobacillus niacini]|uniref:hypothetical protein n=1 Tax=Neobacillus niacini TaxID=86668 RepID=UPI001C8E100B|nr:hypothetical protein [Neobacillus niacini]MBY0145056.1 hypothetical protein [Neobacillus niacini]
MGIERSPMVTSVLYMAGNRCTGEPYSYTEAQSLGESDSNDLLLIQPRKFM